MVAVMIKISAISEVVALFDWAFISLGWDS